MGEQYLEHMLSLDPRCSKPELQRFLGWGPSAAAAEVPGGKAVVLGWTPRETKEGEEKEDKHHGERRPSLSSTNSDASTAITSNAPTESSCSSLPAYVNMNMSEDLRQELAQQELQAEKFRSMLVRRRSIGACEERILKHYENCLADTEARVETLRLSLGIDGNSFFSCGSCNLSFASVC